MTEEPAPYGASACRWVHDDLAGYWATDCDNAFEFTDGGPPENDFRFCPYCGRALTSVDDEANDGAAPGDC